MKNINVVVVGGGSGTMAVLSGLKKFKDLQISVIVSMTDDGGSNAVIRDEFGLLPLSDLRKSIIALAETDNLLLRQLFIYRFDKGKGISGHTLGNLMMAALSSIAGGELNAIEAACRLFQVRGRVLPVTFAKTNLVAEYDSGEKVTGEHLIDEPKKKTLRHIKKLYLKPSVKASSEVLAAIQKADYIIAGPGDLYTSTLANIIVEGVAKAIKKNTGKFIFITNLMTKKGQTDSMAATDLVTEIARYSHRLPDIVVVGNKQINKSVLIKYRKRGESPIKDDLAKKQPYDVIRADVTTGSSVKQDSGDTLVRSLIRHDANKLGKVLRKIIK